MGERLGERVDGCKGDFVGSSVCVGPKDGIEVVVSEGEDAVGLVGDLEG